MAIRVIIKSYYLLITFVLISLAFHSTMVLVGFSTTGNWIVSDSAPGFYSTNYAHAEAADDSESTVSTPALPGVATKFDTLDLADLGSSGIERIY